MNEPQMGMRVIGIRGVSVGQVMRVEAAALLVRPREPGQEVWISREAVIGVEEDRVELICDATEIYRYQVDAPD